MNCPHGMVAKHCPQCTTGSLVPSLHTSSSYPILGNFQGSSSFILPTPPSPASPMPPSLASIKSAFGNHTFAEALSRARRISNTSSGGKLHSNFQFPKIEVLVENLMEDPWPVITMKVLPLFYGVGLSTSVEELNILLTRYIEQQLYGTILEELKALLKEGVMQFTAKFELQVNGAIHVQLDSPSGDQSNPTHLNYKWLEAWKFYHRTVLPYLQAIFLPLQMEIKGSRLVSSIQTLVLLSFRDHAIFPYLDSLEETASSIIQANQPSNTNLVVDPVNLANASLLLQMLLILDTLPAPQKTNHGSDDSVKYKTLKEILQKLKLAVLLSKKRDPKVSSPLS